MKKSTFIIANLIILSTVYFLSRYSSTSDEEAQNYTAQWNHTGEINKVQLSNGFTLRYLKDGSGPNLILLHTARSQLDYFQKLIPLLTKHYTVYAIDLPGHGWSTINSKTNYTEPLFRETVSLFIKKLQLNQLTMVGDSVGAVLSVTIAAEMPDKVIRSVAVNLFDYPEGVQRANILANIVVGAYKIPGLNYIFSNLENKIILGQILKGGFYDSSKMPDALLAQFARVGRRSEYPSMERSLFTAMPSFVAARKLYPHIKTKVTLVYSTHDWSNKTERNANKNLIPNAKIIMLKNSGHFASLEQPKAIATIILNGSGL